MRSHPKPTPRPAPLPYTPFLLVLALALLLPACGGGGGTPPPDGSGAPLVVSAGDDVVAAAEQDVVLTGSAASASGDTPTWSWAIVSGGGGADILSGQSQQSCTLYTGVVGTGERRTLTIRCTATTSDGTASDDVDVEVVSNAAIVYVARGDGASGPSIYAYDLASQANREVFPPAATGSSPSSIFVSPAGTHVLVRDDRETLGDNACFVASLDGGSPVRVSPDASHGSADATVSGMDAPFNPDGTRLLVRGDFAVNGVNELFSVRPDGTGLTRLHAPLTQSGAGTTNPRWSPNGRHVAFRMRTASGQEYRLHVCDADGGNLVAVTPAGAPGGVSTVYAWSPTSDRLLLIGDLATANVNEVYVVPRAGGALTTVSGAMAMNGDAVADDDTLRWSPDGTRVCYEADQLVDGANGIHVAFADGSGDVRVDAPGHMGAQTVDWAAFTPSGDALLFASDHDSDNVEALFRAALDGSGVVPLGTAGLSVDGVREGNRCGFDRVCYRVAIGGGIDDALIVAPTDGSAATNLVSQASASGQLVLAAFADRGETFAWRRSSSLSPADDGIWAATPYTPPVQVGVLGPGESGFGFPILSPHGDVVAYLVDPLSTFEFRIRVAATDGGGASELPLPTGVSSLEQTSIWFAVR